MRWQGFAHIERLYVVSNSSPLIGLERIGRQELLAQLFGTVFVPPAVIQETMGSRVPPAWLIERQLTRPIDAHIIDLSLGAGETETIALAVEVGATWVLLDDAPARRLGKSMNLPLVGTMGVLLMAKDAGILSAVKPYAEELLAADFRVSPTVVSEILRLAGEAD